LRTGTGGNAIHGAIVARTAGSGSSRSGGGSASGGSGLDSGGLSGSGSALGSGGSGSRGSGRCSGSGLASAVAGTSLDSVDNGKEFTVIVGDIPNHGTSQTLTESKVNLGSKRNGIIVGNVHLGGGVEQPRSDGGVIEVTDPWRSSSSGGSQDSLGTQVLPLPETRQTARVGTAVGVLPVSISLVTLGNDVGLGLVLGPSDGHVF
jgi:hypothetical protein